MSDIVERLRAATHYPPFVYQEAADEIERLHEALDIAHKMRPLPEYRDDPRLQEVIEEQRAEIERLRGAYEQERKDCINLTEKVIPNLRDEIERLRGLLRENLAAYEAGIGQFNEWIQRVREALGDE
jgi:hypothetical protein